MSSTTTLNTRTLSIPAANGGTLTATEFLPSTTPDADAPTLILSHGWTLTRASWEPVVREVQSHRAVRVITYDQRGHGRSTWGSLTSQSIKGLADDLTTVIAATAPTGPLVLGGHSMGGMTILAYAGSHSSDFRDRVRGVALVSTTASIDGRTEARGEALAMAVAARVPLLRTGMFVPSRVLRDLNFGENPDKGSVRDMTRLIGQTSLATLGRYFASIRDHDETEALAEFADIPTHVLVGTKDRLTPVRWARSLHDGIPGSQLTVLPGKGHMLMHEATEVVGDAIIELVDQR
ncbi:putative lipase [Janibacter sp. HTCC2649]|uniref:alpha/beta fold hydrolase n=1 Tax=Janibacter sp. HTCC2649 TaxID=313589 RepID=UPI000067199B|nr:alpha/beta hydrolase [Janibacter sp. HTCC2649]EAP98388.1 putative lipase [Janibacter sp. HTCC2649]